MVLVVERDCNLKPDAANMFKMLIRAGSVSKAQYRPAFLSGVLPKNVVGVDRDGMADTTQQGQIVV